MVALPRKFRGRSLRVLIGLASTGNYLSAQCQTALELEVKPEEDFLWLTLADGSEVHAQGYVQFILHCGNYKTRILSQVFPNLREELILGIPWLVQDIPQLIWQLDGWQSKEMEQYTPCHATVNV